MVFYLLLSGGRNYLDYLNLEHEVDLVISQQEGIDKVIIVSGGAKGTDYLAEVYAKKHNYENVIMEAEWTNFNVQPCVIRRKGSYTYNAVAGNNRNTQMIEFIALKELKMTLAFWDYNSTGTKDTIDKSRRYGIPTKIIDIRKDT